jgi:hypothetical protein
MMHRQKRAMPERRLSGAPAAGERLRHRRAIMRDQSIDPKPLSTRSGLAAPLLWSILGGMTSLAACGDQEPAADLSAGRVDPLAPVVLKPDADADEAGRARTEGPP